MSKYFVYYRDDYENMGGVGLEEFDTQKEALEFIEDRLRMKEDSKLSNYKLIKGTMLKLTPKEKVTKVAVEE